MYLTVWLTACHSLPNVVKSCILFSLITETFV